VFLVALVIAAYGGAASAQDQPPTVATAELKDAAGKVVGNALLTAVGDGAVRVQAWVGGLPAGSHGIHIHAVGACTPDFAAAGGHFNPEGAQHGLDNPKGAHAGDMPGLSVGADGYGAYDAINARVSLGGSNRSLFDADGSALVIHANADDQVTDPTGNSGGRIACGVISLWE
jgi:Cu-Zn family superoxide dismutase